MNKSKKKEDMTDLHMKIPVRLKEEFAEVCTEKGISLSDGVRELVSKEIRNFRRKN